MARISEELVTAAQFEQELFDRQGHHRGLRDVDPIPTMSSEMIAASERVEVLQHQLDEVTERFRRRQGYEDV
jgi:hypothetical protein